MFRTSIALRKSWGDRLRTIINRKDISLPEQIRRWITVEEWLDSHTAEAAAEPLLIQHTDGTLERVRLVVR